MDIQPKTWETDLDPVALNAKIKILGVGGGGGNAVATMYQMFLNSDGSATSECGYFICNTDRQALDNTDVPNKIQLGAGLGAGCDPSAGRDIAIADLGKLNDIINRESTKILFLAAGMGGGTGTGATPVIANFAKSLGILTIAVVTVPFRNEGENKYSAAMDGVMTLKDNVDCLILIDNEKLYSGDYLNLKTHEAYTYIDRILATSVLGIAQIITQNGKHNIDLKDARNMLSNGGLTLVGMGEGSGDNRVEDAINNAFNTSLLFDIKADTTSQVMYNITTPTGEGDITMAEQKLIGDSIQAKCGKDANMFKHGIVYDSDSSRGDKICLTVIATGIDMGSIDNFIDTQKSTIVIIEEGWHWTKADARKEKERIAKGRKKSGRYNEIQAVSGIDQRMGQRIRISEEPALLTQNPTERKNLEKIPAISRKNGKKN